MAKLDELTSLRVRAAGYLSGCSPDGSDFEKGQHAAMATTLKWVEKLQNSPESDEFDVLCRDRQLEMNHAMDNLQELIDWATEKLNEPWSVAPKDVMSPNELHGREQALHEVINHAKKLQKTPEELDKEIKQLIDIFKSDLAMCAKDYRKVISWLLTQNENLREALDASLDRERVLAELDYRRGL
jgi:phosphomevalonate kinase